MMVLLEMHHRGLTPGKQILVIDPDPRDSNDRTWCFWDRPGGKFDSIAFRQWDSAFFIDNRQKLKMDLAPYRYKMVRGQDFFTYARQVLFGTYDVINESVTAWEDTGSGARITAGGKTFTCRRLFNSIFSEKSVTESPQHYLRQHFIGWKVRTANAVFDPGTPTFMDFSVAQKGNTRFMYVLPFAPNEALVEYTLFSKDLLEDSEYETAIAAYLEELGDGNFEIVEKERGSIPMTVHPFHKDNSGHVTFIGSAGGWTKPSTGYTFASTVKRASKLVSIMAKDGDPGKMVPNPRFTFYDALLIDVLYHENFKGSSIFSALFADGKPAPIFKFLDEETTIAEEIMILAKCPKRTFIGALWRYLTS